MEAKTRTRRSSLRWEILRRAVVPRGPSSSSQSSSPSEEIDRVSRMTRRGFNLIPSEPVESLGPRPNADSCFRYTLPVDGSPQILVTQKADEVANLNDIEISNRYDVDTTGLVCHWPSEEVLAYFCLNHVETFRSKRVIELGSGYGLAGLVIGATTEAMEVVITDGNPLVVDYVQRNIEANRRAFHDTEVRAATLHWNQDKALNTFNSFDIIVASDCTFFKDFHKGLAFTIKCLLRDYGPSEAIFFSPRRGDSLEKFLEKIEEAGLNFCIMENYDAEVWKCHQAFINGDDSWPGYDKDHCYPLLVRIRRPKW